VSVADLVYARENVGKVRLHRTLGTVRIACGDGLNYSNVLTNDVLAATGHG